MIEEKELKFVIVGGTFLALNAGFINAVSLLGIFATTVSHVTGATTKLAISVVDAQSKDFIHNLGSIIAFWFGSVCNGLMIRNGQFRLGRQYGWALILEAAALFLGFILLIRNVYFAEYVLAYACGFQNAMAATYSGAILRTTHMTGIVTDIGTLVAQLILYRKNAPDSWKLKILVPLFAAYLSGGMIGSVIFRRTGPISLCIPVVIVGGIGVVYLSSGIVREANKLLYREEIERMKRLEEEKNRAAAVVCDYMELNNIKDVSRRNTDNQVRSSVNVNSRDFGSTDGKKNQFM
jgi:uncharacterized membrane protein YoaK (UPF0700 family)